MRISDWSSDVCSSDLCDAVRAAIRRIEKQYGKREDGVPVGEDSERNEFYASKGLYGRVSVKGDLDAVNGARLITLLSSLSAPIPEKDGVKDTRSEEHTSELQSLMRISYAVFCLKKKNK